MNERTSNDAASDNTASCRNARWCTGIVVGAAALSLNAMSSCAASSNADSPTEPVASAKLTPAQLHIAGYWEGTDIPTIKSLGKLIANGPPPGAGFGAPKDLQDALRPEVKEALQSRAPQRPDSGGGCNPYSLPSVGAGAGIGSQIILAPEVTVILYEEDHNMRIIQMNGIHPAALTPSRTGHSIGHWQGDTLVVDTTGFDPAVDSYVGGVPASSTGHIIERFHASADGTKLELSLTYDDPTVFAKPYTVTAQLKKGERFQEYVTAENNLLGCPAAAVGNVNRAPD